MNDKLFTAYTCLHANPKKRSGHFIAFLLIAISSFLYQNDLFAQVPGSEADVIKQANTYFENEQYPNAMPLYSQLLSNHKDNANYNYRYGVCVLYASPEKDKGLQYLLKASKSSDVEVDVWFYLGKAYHLNYQFESAIVSYNKYKTLAGAKKAEKLQVDNQIAMCKTGRKLLKAITDITVLEKAELNEADFFRHYDLKGAGYSGQLLVKPTEFQTALDKKKKEQSIIFLSGEKNELYFSSYGADETQGKDIYVVRKLPNGNWGKPQNVGYPINTEYDEDYPFLHPNGKVLYFSSKGHNSMGGYDIFRAELNEETNTWQKPSNLDFAINSPDDDIMFVSDLDEKTAWFASSRNSPEGKMTVYHVVIERKPVNMCLIAGTFSSTDGDANRAAKITVKNTETSEVMGVYASNASTGTYLINLPNNGGKYSFTVDHSGIATQTQTVFIPPQYQIKAVNQKIGYNEEANESKMFIVTDFEADTSMLDAAFLKDKAKLDINGDAATQIVDLGHKPGTLPEAGGIDTGTGNEEDSTDTVDVSSTVPSSNTGVSNAELVKSANDDALATQQEVIDLDKQTDRAFSYANQLNDQAKAKMKEAQEAKALAEGMQEGPEKAAAVQRAKELFAEANSLQSQFVAAVSIAEALDRDTKNKQLEADKSKQYATSLDNAVKSNDPKALDAAIAQGNELQSMSEVRPESGQTAKNLQNEADKKQAELDKAKTTAQDLKDEIAQNQQRIDQLNAEKAKEKDPEIKQGIEQQIIGINEDIVDVQKQLDVAENKVNILQNQSNDLDNQAKAANNALVQSKNPSVGTTPLTDADKKLLTDEAVAYQNNVSESGTSKTFSPVTQTGNQSGTPVVTQQGTQTNTQAGTETQSGTQTVTQSGTETQSGTQTVTQSGTETQSGVDTTTTIVVVNEDLEAPFIDAISKTDTISDPIAREKAKADVYNNWVTSIEDQIKEKKQELAGTKDKTKKNELNADIKKLQASANEKKQDSKNAVAAADKAQKEQIASQKNPTIVSSDDQFEKLLAVADQQPSIAEKENSKAQVYSDWADSLDAKANAKENSLLKIKNKSQQEKVKQEIVALHQEADVKRNLSDEAKAKAAASTVSTQQTVTQPVNLTDVNYNDPTATAALNEQKQLLDQAQENRKNQDSLTNLASNASGQEKNQLLGKATEQQRLAWDKETQASAKLGDADKAQFNKNNEQLKGFDAAAVNSNDPSVATAALLSVEAKNLFEKANQERDSANLSTNNYIKSEALHNAEENEKKALQKQQEAIALYTKSGIEPITSTAVVTQPVTQTQSGTQTTTDPVTQTQSGTQTTTDPVTQTQSGTQTTTDPVTQTQSGTQTTTDPVTQTQTGTQTTTDPVTQTQSGTQTTTDPVTQTQTGTQTTTDPVTQTQSGTQSSAQQIIDPLSGQPLTSIQVDKIRSTEAYSNYVAASTEAIKSEKEVSIYKSQADIFQDSVNTNVSKAQDLALLAADEKNKKKKQDLINQSNLYNDAAKNFMASRDSVNELADAAKVNANANKNKAEFVLQGIDKPTADQVKAVAIADQNNPNYVARTGTQTQSGTETTTQPVTQSGIETTTQPVTQSGTETTTQPVTQSGIETTTQPVTQSGTETTTQPVTQSGTESSKQGGDNTSIVAKRLSPGEEFKINSQPTVIPIKVNPDMPEGLVYKVQIGAFRNPISPEIYNGIQPVTAETTSSGLTRYTAGLFREFTNADAAKNEIRGMGYRDAFVVAFYNGKRISIDEARRLSAGSSTQPVAGTQTQPTSESGTQSGTPTQTQPTTDSGSQTQSGTQTPTYQGSSTAVDVISLKGLFYTVQVGVYKNEVSKAKLKNLPDLVSERVNGFIRYSSGKYCTPEDASSAKSNAVAKGITDAFVTAYYNGKRISITEAKALEASGVTPCQGGTTQTLPQSGNTPSETQPSIQSGGSQSGGTPSGNSSTETQSTTQSSGSPSGNASTETQAPTEIAGSQSQSGSTSSGLTTNTKPPVPETGLVFCVQIGAFRDEVPVEIANQFLQLSSRGVKNYLDSNSGLTVYQVGVCATKDEAETLKAEAISKGITDSFIVAFKDGKKISMEEALQASGQ